MFGRVCFIISDNFFPKLTYTVHDIDAFLLISFFLLKYWLCDQKNPPKQTDKKKNCVMSGLRCVCVGGKSSWSPSLAAAPPALVQTSPTHSLANTERWREHYRRRINLTVDSIPSQKMLFSSRTRCCPFVFLLRDPRGRRDISARMICKTEHTEHKSGPTLSSTIICSAILFHPSHVNLLLLFSTTCMDLKILIKGAITVCAYLPATCHAGDAQTAIAVSWMLQRQVDGAKNPCGRNQTDGAVGGWRLNRSQRGHREEEEGRCTYIIKCVPSNWFHAAQCVLESGSFCRIPGLKWDPETSWIVPLSCLEE